MKTLLTALCLVLGLTLVTPVQAAEQRCNDLGANCVCSRTLAASSWVRNEVAGRGDLWREADQTPNDAKLCGERSGQWAYVSTAGAAAGTSGGLASTTGLSGLTGMVDQGLSTMLTPNPTHTASLHGRTGIRYYIKLGSGYQSTNDGACSNDKYTQLGDYFTAFNTGYTTSNGGSFSPNLTPSMVIGKWMRIEHYIENYGMGATTHTIHFTDVATQIEKTMSVGSRLSQIQLVTDIIHKYRAGSCNGTSTMMYAMMATGLASGQRIGAAAELESGAPPPPPPPPPPTGCVITPTPAALAFTHPVGGPLPAPQSIMVTTSDGTAWRTNDTGFYDASLACWAGGGGSCASGQSTTVSPTNLSLGFTANTYTYPLSIMAGVNCPEVIVPVVLVVGAPAPPPPPPVSTLSVYITQPKANATVKGTVWVVMWVEGTSAGSNIFTLSADGTQIATRTTTSKGPVSIPWQTQSLTNGAHTLAGTVRDAAGNTGTKSITVIVTH